MTYGLVVLYVTSGRGDEHLGAEWIHKAYRFSQLSRHDNPLLGLVIPLERLLQAPEEAVTAFESLLDSVDPWVRAMARLAGRQDAHRVRPGRPGGGGPVWSWRSRSSGRSANGSACRWPCPSWRASCAMRGELAGACEYYDEAIAVLTELGAVEDVIEVRTQQALLYWLNGDREASAATIAEAERSAEGVTWPYALVNLALAKAELARLGGDAEEARRQLGLATTLLGDAAEQPVLRAEIHNLLGYLADDLAGVPHPPRGCLAGGVRAGRAHRDRPDPRRVRGPGGSPRPVRAGGAACSRPASAYADCRIARTRMRPGSSGTRGVTSAKHGSPR